jgi:hypothetical protein
MVQSLRRRRLDGPRFPPKLLSLSLTSNRLIQGGGILTAFTSFFPDLVDDKVLLIAPTGLVEVSSSVMYTARYRTQTRSQSKDLSKTTKFMSSPFVQSVTSSAPFRVRG